MLVVFALYLIGKNRIEEDIRNDEPVINDNYLSLSLGIGNIGYFISLILFVLTVSASYNDRVRYDQRVMIIVSLIFFANIIFYFILQKKIIDFSKSYRPEKEGKVTDLNFNKKWLESSDEREKSQIYQSGYNAYRAMSTASMVIMMVQVILIYNDKIGIFPLLTTMIIYLIGVITNLYYSIKLNA